jgi:aryl-alcohol dehydrogenase-like predicted oxidoreductase
MPLKLALGSAQLGGNYGIANKTGKPSQEEATALLAHAILGGIKTIDTASAYGNSEEVIGNALTNIDRSGLIISTKLSPSILDNANSEAEIYRNIDKSIETSLNALKTSRLDILMLHRWSHFKEANGLIWKRLLYWQNKEAISKLGASLVSPLEALEALGQSQIQFIQIPFNILDWRFRDANIQDAIARRPDATIQTRSAFLQGLLVSPSTIWPKNSDISAQNIILELEKMVADFGRKNRADLCLAYLRSTPWINSIVIGMETLEQLQNNIELFDTPLLSKQQIEIIEKTFINYPETLLNPSLWSKA